MELLVIFDGECGLCNRFVAWLIQRDTRAQVAVIGSASPLAQRVLEASGLPPVLARSTIVVWDGQRMWTHSAAVMRIVRALPFPTRLLAAGWIVPRPLRDAIYRFIAARRPGVEADDAACGVPPTHLVDLWRSRLATAEVVERIEARASARAHQRG